MANFIIGIISLSIGAVVLSGVFITTVKAATLNASCAVINGSGVEVVGECAATSSETALWGLLTIVGIAGLVYGVLNVFGLA